MINKKVIALSLALSLGTSIGIGQYYASQVAYAQEVQASQVDKTQDGVSGKVRNDKTIDAVNNASFRVINDSTGTISDESISSITQELNNIHEHAPKTFERGLQMYTFIYDSPSKKVQAAANEIVEKNSLDSSIAPLIFVYNKSDKTYHFIADTRIVKYVASNYVTNLADKLFENGINDKNLKEYMIRVESSVSMAIEDDIDNISSRPINAEANKKHFTVKNFGYKDNLVNNNKKNHIDEQKETETTKQDNTFQYGGILAFVLALASVGIVFYRRKVAKKK